MKSGQVQAVDTRNSTMNLVVHNVYTKSLTFEAPNSPSIFSSDWDPRLTFDMKLSNKVLVEGLYEFVISVSVKVELASIKKSIQQPKETAFIIKVQQAGIFSPEGLPGGEQVDDILRRTAPRILFPYIREVVSNIVAKGGFPQLILPPMSFEEIFLNVPADTRKD